MDIDKINLKKIRPVIKRYKNKFKERNIYGFDVETVNGKMFSFQIYNEEINDFILVKDLSHKEIIDIFFKKYKSGIFYAHNLNFDLGNLFKEIILEDKKRFQYFGYKGVVIYPHPCYGTINNGKLYFVFGDTMPFFPMSLKAASKFIGSKIKMKAPEYLGKREPNKKEMKYFRKYAMIDAEIAYKLGMLIVGLHKEFNINTSYSVSIASLSAKIYRKYFQKEDIKLPNKKIIKMALLAFHGGRTEAFGYGKMKSMKCIDINSSYPSSMSKIKIPIEDKWVKTYELNEDGFYKISGYMPKTKISPMPLRLDNMLKFPCGKFDNVIVTGIEAKRIRDISAKFKVVEGWKYTGKYDYSMRDFVLFFYIKKKEAKRQKDKIKYHFYKIIMNSLYGKTIQLNSEKTANYEDGYKCGKGAYKIINRRVPAGMFNPVIAAWITAYSRIMLYDKMKEYEKYAAYCDTDSIFLSRNCPKIKLGKNLGEWDIESSGSLILIREKLYLISNKDKMLKSGRHSFRGNKDLFFKCIMNKENKYNIDRMIQLKEGIIQNKIPFTMENREFVLNFFGSKKRISNFYIKSYDKNWYWNKPLHL